jgi:ribosome-associated translation inhibitor RaiA
MSHVAHSSGYDPSANWLSIRTRGIESTGKLRQVISSCVAAATRRFQERTRGLFVWVEDTNGPRGGPAMQCRMEVELKRGQRFVVTAAASDQYVAVSRAAQRLRARLIRAIGKRRSRRRERPQLPVVENETE